MQVPGRCRPIVTKWLSRPDCAAAACLSARAINKAGWNSRYLRLSDEDRVFHCRAWNRHLRNPVRMRRVARPFLPAVAARAVAAPCRTRRRRACRCGRLRVDQHKFRTMATPTLPDSAEQRSHPRQSVVDEFFGDQIERRIVLGGEARPVRGIRTTGAAGLARAFDIDGRIVRFHVFGLARNEGAGHQVSFGASQIRLLRHFARSRSRRSGYFSSR